MKLFQRKGKGREPLHLGAQEGNRNDPARNAMSENGSYDAIQPSDDPTTTSAPEDAERQPGRSLPVEESTEGVSGGTSSMPVMPDRFAGYGQPKSVSSHAWRPGLEDDINDAVQVSLRAGGASECGPRPKNDDSFDRSKSRDFFAISDGIGGAPHGDVISRISCRAAVQAHDLGRDIFGAFSAAADKVRDIADDLGQGDGATLLLVERVGAVLNVVSVGDTHAYLYRAGELKLLNPEGRADPSLGRPANALDKAVGAGAWVEPDYVSVSLEPGDRLLLCTDGVWFYMHEDGMASALAEVPAQDPDVFSVASSICWAAVDTFGGRDNATCIFMAVGDIERGERAGSEELARIANRYASGEGVTQSDREAFRFWKWAAKLDGGDADVQYRLGRAFEEGRGTPQDYGQACAHYRSAAEAGSLFAYRRLGTLYLGDEEPGLANEPEAVRCLSIAARCGDPIAAYRLGQLFKRGLAGREPDLRKAASCFELSARLGGLPVNGEVADPLPAEKPTASEQGTADTPYATPLPSGTPYR